MPKGMLRYYYQSKLGIPISGRTKLHRQWWEEDYPREGWEDSYSRTFECIEESECTFEFPWDMLGHVARYGLLDGIFEEY